MSNMLYKNHPLPDPNTHIRLLLIHPGRQDEPLKCNLSTAELSDCPDFKAISYTWGAAEPLAEVQVNGHSISVRKNCHYALWQARLHLAGQHVWIDSICINQNDLEEKSAQVGMMYDIFAASAKVLACIGPHDKASRHFERFTHDIRAALALARPRDGLGESFASTLSMDDWAMSQDPMRLEKLYGCLLGFDGRPYWKRVWVLQEIFAAGSRGVFVLCGESIIEWELMLTSATVLSSIAQKESVRRSKLLRKRPQDIKGVSDVINGHPLGRGLSSMADLLSSFQCEDPRDRIFGALRLIDWPAGINPPQPDYSVDPFDLASRLWEPGKNTHLTYDPLFEMLGMCSLRPSPTLDSPLQGLKSDPTSMRHFELCIDGCGSRLFADGEGRLSVALAHPDAVNTSRAISERTVQPFSNHVSVFTGCKISALVCPQARAGDVILQSGKSALIVRREKDDLCLVGQAILINGFVCHNEKLRPCECFDDDFNVWGDWFGLLVELSYDEAALLTAQETGYRRNANEGPFSVCPSEKRIVEENVIWPQKRPLLNHMLECHTIGDDDEDLASPSR